MSTLEIELGNRLRVLENRVYNLERIELPVAGSGGFIAGSGTAGRVSKFTSASVIGDSQLKDSVTGGVLDITATLTADRIITFADVAGTVTLGTGAATRVAFFSGTNTLTTNANFIYTTGTNQLSLTAGAATDTPLKIIGAAAQSADLFDILDSAGGTIISIASSGLPTHTRYAANANLQLRRANGSFGAETQVTATQVISLLSSQSWDNVSAFINIAQIRNVAIDNITATTRDSQYILTFFDDSGTAQSYYTFNRSGVVAITGGGVSNTNTVNDRLALTLNSTGSAAAGFGQAILFNLESSTTNAQNAARMSVFWTTATHASRTSVITFDVVTNAGALTEALRIGGATVVVTPNLQTSAGIVKKVATKAADYTLTTNDDIVTFTATATATLPAASGSGQTYRIICRSGTLTIDGNGSDTVKGSLTAVLTAGEDLVLTDTAATIWE